MIQEKILAVLSGLPGAEHLQNPYIAAGVMLLIAVLLAKFVVFLFESYLKKAAAKTKTKVDDLLFEKTERPIFYLIVVFGVKIAMEHIGINGTVVNTVHSLLAVVFVLLISRVVDVIIIAWGDVLAKRTHSNIDDVLLPLFHKSTSVIFIIIGLMWVLSIWDIDITPYLAGAGIFGLIMGMALQDSLKNIFGGVSLILDKNFNIGDAVQLEGGEMGTIQDIGLRSTKMVTYNNELIFIPNGQLASMKIRNFVRPNNRIRKIVEFSVGYGTNPEKVKTVVMKALKTMKGIYDDPYMDVIFVEMGDSGLLFKARFWAEWDDGYAKWLEATEVIYQALNKAKIDIPFPTRTIHMKKG